MKAKQTPMNKINIEQQIRRAFETMKSRMGDPNQTHSYSWRNYETPLTEPNSRKPIMGKVHRKQYPLIKRAAYIKPLENWDPAAFSTQVIDILTAHQAQFRNTYNKNHILVKNEDFTDAPLQNDTQTKETFPKFASGLSDEKYPIGTVMMWHMTAISSLNNWIQKELVTEDKDEKKDEKRPEEEKKTPQKKKQKITTEEKQARIKKDSPVETQRSKGTIITLPNPSLKSKSNDSSKEPLPKKLKPEAQASHVADQLSEQQRRNEALEKQLQLSTQKAVQAEERLNATQQKTASFLQEREQQLLEMIANAEKRLASAQQEEKQLSRYVPIEVKWEDSNDSDDARSPKGKK